MAKKASLAASRLAGSEVGPAGEVKLLTGRSSLRICNKAESIARGTRGAECRSGCFKKALADNDNMKTRYIDIPERARKDAAWLESVMSDMRKMDEKAPAAQRESAMLSVIKKCGQNMGLLLPWFFPAFAGPGNPLSLVTRPYAFPFFSYLLHGYMVLRGSRQIGKSTSFTARQLMMSKMLPWFSAYIAPHSEHTKTYALKLDEMKSVFRYGKRSSGQKDNMYLKQFKTPLGLSQISVHRVLTSASHMRGKTADELLYDEYQLFDMRLEAELRQMQRVTEKPVTIYSGTSTTVDSPLESRFQSSSGGIWQIRGPAGHMINCGDPKKVLEMIRPRGLTCPYSDRLILNPQDGLFDHMSPGKLEQNIIGLHVPQFIIPQFSAPDEWSKIYDYLQEWGEARFLQEVAGIPVETGNAEITQADLQAICTLPYATSSDIQTHTRKNSPYRFVVSGCDWGGSDYEMAKQAKTSYTVHLMLGVKGDGTCHILHMHRYSGMNYDEIATLIVKKHLELGGNMLLSDYGAGYAYNTFLHRDSRINPGKHFVLEYNAPYSPILSRVKHPHFPAHYLLNKTESITFLFEAIKKQRIQCYGWAEAQSCLSDLLHSKRVHAENRHGRQYFLHIRNNPSLPDDTLHALNFAFVGARLLLRERLFADDALHQTVDAMMSSMFGTSSSSFDYSNMIQSV